MTLYDRIKEQERYIEELRKSVLFCRANGFKVDGEYPHLKEEARGLLEMDAYRHNPVIQEMRDGRKLREIVDEHFSTWKFWRRYSLGEVREFNKSNEPLKGVLPSAGGAEREYFFSAFAPEGCSFCFGAVISSATGFLFYWFGNQEMKEFFPRIIALSGVIGLGLGAFFGYHISTPLKRVRKRMDEAIRYIDNVLEEK